MRVFVLDNQKQPLMPCKPARARKLLRDGKAAVFRRFPFTIILKWRTGGETQPVAINVDPGSKQTGVALIADFQGGKTAIFALHIVHRGSQIKSSLEARRAIRRGRRNRHTRYRQPRFDNRARPNGWLPPSIESRVFNVETMTRRLSRLATINSANIETVRFDTQLIENPEISGVEYQQGSLFGWELREYLLYRHKHQCAYCNGLSGDPILEKEHILPKALGGTNRLANHVISCRACNQNKGALHPEVWTQKCSKSKSKINQARTKNMEKILKGQRPSLKDAAAVNATRKEVARRVQQIIPDTRLWSGGRTKKNRTEQGYPKAHWIDAACVGENGNAIHLECSQLLIAEAKGHGSRQMCRVNKFGFPRTSAKQKSEAFGFKTGDLVTASVPEGARKGFHSGRVAIRASGYFDIQTNQGAAKGVSHRYCTLIQRSDGYNYLKEAAIHPITDLI